MAELQELRDKLFKRSDELHEAMNIKLGETAAPGYMTRCALEDISRLPVNEEYFRQLSPEYNAFREKIIEILAQTPEFDSGTPFTEDNIWLWGGPTPEWGGSMQPDTLARNAKYYNAANGVYVYGRTSDEMVALHADMKNLLVMVTNSCRAPGQQPESDAECAENLSRLSLKYPNIRGGMIDDMTVKSQEITSEKIEHIATVSRNLKKHNPDLELFGVVYCHELGKKDYSGILPSIDGVNLWYWYQEELLELEKYVDICRDNFPGKKLYLGLFIHDYGTSDAGAVPELLIHQLKGGRKLLAEGKIDALVILGDREILKWPEQAAAVKGFLSAN